MPTAYLKHPMNPEVQKSLQRIILIRPLFTESFEYIICERRKFDFAEAVIDKSPFISPSFLCARVNQLSYPTIQFDCELPVALNESR